MDIRRISFRGASCFKTDWVGFDSNKPINVIIGRNNSGKSQLLELVQICCQGFTGELSRRWEFLCEGTADEAELRQVFPQAFSGGDMQGNHWSDNGAKYVDAPLQWQSDSQSGARSVEVSVDSGLVPSETHKTRLTQMLSRAVTPYHGSTFRHLLADRDIQSESPQMELNLLPNGSGATNIIRRHLTSSSEALPRDRIQVLLRSALNQIFGQDGQFTEIQVQHHDERNGDAWEIYLAEESKGLVSLSRSGSGLKTVILVLLHLLVVPKVSNSALSKTVFAFEELENNLHPSLLRRLLRFIEEFALEHDVRVFLTTHSSTTLDLFGASPHAQIIHVTHDGSIARSTTVTAHFDKLTVLGELGARPSDILQANGIVWVEGPSDAIYLKKWIDLVSGGRFREGRDFVCAFYGGSLLARTQFVEPDVAEDELVNLLALNPNVVVVCDGDRLKAGAHLKKRVTRIRKELSGIPGSEMWVTQPKEIEGYLSGSLIARSLALTALSRDVDEYERFFPSESKDGSSYVESVLRLGGVDKMELAIRAGAICTLDDLRGRFDWYAQISRIVSAIERWNA